MNHSTQRGVCSTLFFLSHPVKKMRTDFFFIFPSQNEDREDVDEEAQASRESRGRQLSIWLLGIVSPPPRASPGMPPRPGRAA